MIITRMQIKNVLNGYVKDYIVDAEWHIRLVEDFMYLLDGDNFESDNLESPTYIKSILELNRQHEYARKVLMRKDPEGYISALFGVIVRIINAQNLKFMKIRRMNWQTSKRSISHQKIVEEQIS